MFQGGASSGKYIAGWYIVRRHACNPILTNTSIDFLR